MTKRLRKALAGIAALAALALGGAALAQAGGSEPPQKPPPAGDCSAAIQGTG